MPLEIVRDDITRMRVDAIVNAANTTLLGGGGVDGAIHAAAGPELLEACRQLHGCPTGQAKITEGYRLPARYVIHTPGPVWAGGGNGERGLLASCYRSSLALAEEYRCESIAFPMISTGAYGYPKDEALRVALEEITSFLRDHDMQVYIVTFGKEMFETTGKLFSSVRAYISDAYAEEAERKFSRNRLRRYSAGGISSLPADGLLKEAAPPAPNAPRSPGQGVGKKSRRKEPQADACAGLAGVALPEDDLILSAPKAVSQPDLIDYLRAQDIGFSEALLNLIDEKGMTDVQCYKQANIDRKLFNHIKNKKDYRPTKKTALAFTVALHLSPGEAESLLRHAGYSLSSSSPLDLAIRYFLQNSFYDIHQINVMLYDLDLPLLGA